MFLNPTLKPSSHAIDLVYLIVFNTVLASYSSLISFRIIKIFSVTELHNRKTDAK